MKINAEILSAYYQCKLKSFFLLKKKRKKKSHDFVAEIERRKQLNLRNNKSLFEKNMISQLDKIDFTGLNKKLTYKELECFVDTIFVKEGKSNSNDYTIEPVHFLGINKPTIEDKIRLAFAGYVLSKIYEIDITHGKLVLFNANVRKIKLSNFYQKIEDILLEFETWENPKADKPLLILNKHCHVCEFKDTCFKEAKENSNLSLLGRINNEKGIQKYYKKGIFNILQLACLYKPRRRKKKMKETIVKHSFELQALAIKEKKIYIKKEPNLARKEIELFLDVETIPDEDFCYLIGISLRNETEIIHHNYWADSLENEKENLLNAVNFIRSFPNAPIYHYGNYDEKVIKGLGKKYELNVEDIQKRLYNLNSFIFGKIYFPVYSNSLKEISEYLGLSNDCKIGSGLESLVFRYKWERKKNDYFKTELITYNKFDCDALLNLVDKLSQISNDLNAASTINIVSQPRKNSTVKGEVIHTQLESILRMGHENYDKRKIVLRDGEEQKSKAKVGGVFGHIGKTRKTPKPKREKYLNQLTHCPIHKVELKYSGKFKHKIITDLVFTKSGIRRTVIKYTYEGGFCSNCGKKVFSLETQKLIQQLFGHNFKVWVVYQRVYLRLPHNLIQNFTNIQFNETISSGSITSFMKATAMYYLDTEKLLEQKIKNSSFIHVDETTINIRGSEYYVWAFTDSKNVIFKLTQTREADWLHEFLEDYQGVLISDFYPGYDSIKCKQQKCWVHLIRDINDDLWRYPFDSEYEEFVVNLRNLLVPIFETIHRFGLKKYHFNKFIKEVERYYKKYITDKVYHSERCQKYQKRLIKYEYALFTFLRDDEIPWQNNTGERALRHLAVQRKISGSFFKSGAEHYLRLLGIMQSCRFQNKCFLRFMLSGLIDLDEFKK